jgi:hypothetical protein
MAKNPDKPLLTVVDSIATGISPPRELGQHGLALRNAVMAEYRIEDRGGIELLAQVCAAQDRVKSLKAAIDRDGTKNGPKAHPALRDELQIRSFICRTLERLGLNVEVVKPVDRPSGYASWVPPPDAYEPDAN